MPYNHIFDLESFEENYSFLGVDEIREVCEMYFTEYPKNVALIEKAIFDEDFVAIQFQTHSLKNLLLALFANNPSELVEQMNRLAHDKNIGKIRYSMELLNPMLLLLKEEITNYLRRL